MSARDQCGKTEEFAMIGIDFGAKRNRWFGILPVLR
jgi:hypothetical protein